MAQITSSGPRCNVRRWITRRTPGDVENATERAVQRAFGDERIAAVILSQELIGKKVWTK